jgi:hypothetical protein
MQPAMAREKRNASDDFRIFIRYLICGDAVSKMNFVFGPIRFSWTAAFGRKRPVGNLSVPATVQFQQATCNQPSRLVWVCHTGTKTGISYAALAYTGLSEQSKTQSS